MSHDKLTRLHEKKLALERVIQDLRQRQRADARKARVRREALWGRLVVRWMQRDQAFQEQMDERLRGDLLLTKRQRLLAGLEAAEAGAVYDL